ncbi:hypothetical protein Ciccas_007389 [Cichlidogyrus casuarinus]|uniref:Uncharacterized protein n=1 Tax=Cichlidogyrus casuarinus TaxID=1844966 RepID=A0ABD2Q376_9PLAT
MAVRTYSNTVLVANWFEDRVLTSAQSSSTRKLLEISKRAIENLEKLSRPDQCPEDSRLSQVSADDLVHNGARLQVVNPGACKFAIKAKMAVPRDPVCLAMGLASSALDSRTDLGSLTLTPDTCIVGASMETLPCIRNIFTIEKLVLIDFINPQRANSCDDDSTVLFGESFYLKVAGLYLASDMPTLVNPREFSNEQDLFLSTCATQFCKFRAEPADPNFRIELDGSPVKVASNF